MENTFASLTRTDGSFIKRLRKCYTPADALKLLEEIMVYVAPPDEELLTSAQVEIHAKRGGPQVLFPSKDDAEVKELYEKKKTERDENKRKAEDSGELVGGLHVPSEKENPETIIIAGQKLPNKNLSTPGAAPLVSDNTGVQKEPDPNQDKVDQVTGEVIKKSEEKVDPISGTELPKDSLEPSSLTASTSIESTDLSELSEEERLERLKAGK